MSVERERNTSGGPGSRDQMLAVKSRKTGSIWQIGPGSMWQIKAKDGEKKKKRKEERLNNGNNSGQDEGQHYALVYFCQ